MRGTLRRMSQLSDLAPEVVVAGRYRLIETIGSGGTAAVWRATDIETGADIALKVLRDGVEPSMRERAEREAKVLEQLDHPNLVRVVDSGEDAGVPYLAMQLLEGETLSAIITARGAIPVEEAVALVADVADGLGHAHAAGVLHRDVKPANIVCHETVPTLVDFGIARQMDSTTLTRGLVVGTASYIAPEQAQGLALTPACDVYALGCVLYELLTGAAPFQGDSPVTIALKHVQDEPVPPSDIVPGVPAAIDAIVLRALAKDPVQRPADGIAFAAALRSAAAADGDETVALTPLTQRDPTIVMPLVVDPPPARSVTSDATTKRNLVPLLVAAAIFLGVLLLVRAAAGSGDGGETGPVPDMTNAPVQDATTYLEAAGFEVDVVNVDADAPTGIVVASDPPAGELALDDSVVLSVSSGPPATTAPPTTVEPTEPEPEPEPRGRDKPGKGNKDD
jgi:hypothetical protein